MAVAIYLTAMNSLRRLNDTCSTCTCSLKLIFFLFCLLFQSSTVHDSLSFSVIPTWNRFFNTYDFLYKYTFHIYLSRSDCCYNGV